MRIVGYCICGNKQYVAFSENDERPDRFNLTDGFHDKPVNERNVKRYEDCRWVDQQEINLKKIISRMRGARPWHPLLKVLREEGVA